MLEESLQLGVSFPDVVKKIKNTTDLLGVEKIPNSTLAIIHLCLNNNTFDDLLTQISKLNDLEYVFKN